MIGPHMHVVLQFFSGIVAGNAPSPLNFGIF